MPQQWNLFMWELLNWFRNTTYFLLFNDLFSIHTLGSNSKKGSCSNLAPSFPIVCCYKPDSTAKWHLVIWNKAPPAGCCWRRSRWSSAGKLVPSICLQCSSFRFPTKLHKFVFEKATGLPPFLTFARLFHFVFSRLPRSVSVRLTLRPLQFFLSLESFLRNNCGGFTQGEAQRRWMKVNVGLMYSWWGSGAERGLGGPRL